MGRLLGLGSRRERLVHALAAGHRVPALGHDPGKAQHAEGLEPAADRPHLLAVPVRDLPHAQRHRAIGPRLRPDSDLHLDLPRLRPGDGVRLPGSAAVAPRRDPQPGPPRIHGLARGELPAQQLGVHRAADGRVLGNTLPGLLRGDHRRADRRRSQVLQHDGRPAGAVSAVPDRRGPTRRLAPGLTVEPEPAVCLARHRGDHLRRRLCSPVLGLRRVLSTHGLEPGELRDGDDRTGVRPRHPHPRPQARREPVASGRHAAAQEPAALRRLHRPPRCRARADRNGRLGLQRGAARDREPGPRGRHGRLSPALPDGNPPARPALWRCGGTLGALPRW